MEPAPPIRLVEQIMEPIHAFGAVNQLLAQHDSGTLEVNPAGLWFLLGMLHDSMAETAEKLEIALRRQP